MALFKKEKLDQIEKRQAQETKHGVLLVDDENANLQTLASFLEQHYRVFQASDGQEAYEMMLDSEVSKHIQLILSDQRMPKLTGVQLFERVIEIAPDPIRIILTGFTDVQAVTDSINKAHIYKFMMKPVDHQELLLTLRRALEAYDMRKMLNEYHLGLENKIRERTLELEKTNEELRRTNLVLEEASREILQKHEALNRTQGQLILQEKMAFLGTLTGGIAHELKNPLNFVINFTKIANDYLQTVLNHCGEDLARMPIQAGEDQENLLDLLTEAHNNMQHTLTHGVRANEIINLMMNISNYKTDSKLSVPFNYTVSKYFDLAFQTDKLHFPDLNLTVQFDYDHNLDYVDFSLSGIGRILTNMVRNSFESLAAKMRILGREFQAELRIQTRAFEDRAELSIYDNGMGIPAKFRSQIFLPFFTTKSDTKNIGLGLAIAYDIVVQEHGGQIEVRSEENEYAEFVIQVPRKNQ